MLDTYAENRAATVNLLNELKSQAESRQHDMTYSSGLHKLRGTGTTAALLSIYHYLHELITLLNELHPNISADIDICGIGLLKNLRQGEYRLSSESTPHKEIVRLTFALQSEIGVELEGDETPLIRQQLDLCRLQGLIVSYVSRSPLKICIHGYVPATIEFYSDYTEPGIHVDIQNFSSATDSHYRLHTESINQELLEMLGEYLLRRSTRFLEQLIEDSQTISGNYRTNQNLTIRNKQTKELEDPRLNAMINQVQRLYLTYYNEIKDLDTQTKTYVLGRALDCDLVLNSDLASRYHATIAFQNGKFVIIDQSTNGTFVKTQNGREVYVRGEQAPLSGTGFISLGKSINMTDEDLIHYSCV